MKTKETGRKAIGFEYPHGCDEWLKSRVLKLCKHDSCGGREAYVATTTREGLPTELSRGIDSVKNWK